MRHRPQNRCNTLELCARAAEMLKAVGFERVTTSMRSEACYYRLPSRHGVLRIAAHGSSSGMIGLDHIVSRLTFKGSSFDAPGTMVLSEDKFQTMVAIALGQYMLRSCAPHASLYKGQRGTWEHDQQSQ